MKSISSVTKFIVRWLNRAFSTDRLVITLSITALYGRQLIEAISIGPVAEVLDFLAPVVRGIAVFYWVGVGMMYFLHLFTIRTVYDGFNSNLLRRYPSFQHVFAGIATIVGQSVFVRLFPGKSVPAYLEPVITTHSVVTLLPLFGLLIFAKFRVAEPLTDPDGPYLAILSRVEISREERVVLATANDILRFVPYVMVIAVTALYFTPLLMIGSFTAAMRFYPGVLEVVGIVAVVGSKVLRSPRMGEQHVGLADWLERTATFDSSFYDVISETPLGAGWGFMLALLFGLLQVSVLVFIHPSIGPFPFDAFSIGLGGLPPGSGIPTTHAIGMLTRVWFWLVVVSTPYLLGLFGLWFWYQTARRTPSIIQQHVEGTEAFSSDSSVETPPVARPRGWLLPLTGLLLISVSHPVYQQTPGLGIPAFHAPSVQIAAWVASIGLFGWCIAATTAAEPERAQFPMVELLAPATLTAVILVYAQREWELLFPISIMLALIIFTIRMRRFIDWVYVPSRRSRALRTLLPAVLFGIGGWQMDGTIGMVASGAATWLIFVFCGEWWERTRAGGADGATESESEDLPTES